MKRILCFTLLTFLAITMVAVTGPGTAPASARGTPRWLLHVQRYPGGISNGVRAMATDEVAAAHARYGRSIQRVEPAVGQNNIQMNNDSRPPLPQNETSVDFSLHDPMVAVSGANDYVSIGLAIMRTADGGRTWKTLRQAPQFFPFREPCTGGDPSVAYSVRDRAFYMSTLCFFRTQPQSELHVWKSVNGGATWTPPRLASVAVSNYDRDTGETDESLFFDKELITVDNNPDSPFFGRIYMTYVKFHILEDGFSDYCPAQVAYTDEIPTENPQLAVWEHTGIAPDDPGDDGVGPSANQWATPQIEPDGDLDVIYAQEDCNSGLDRRLLFQKSTDGGATFLRRPVRIDKPGQFKDNPDLGDLLPPTAFRAPISLSLDVNKKTGTLAILYQNNLDRKKSGANISLQRSFDGGMTWTDMRYVSTENGDPARNDQFFSWIDSDEAGAFHAIWFDRRRDPANRDIDTWQAVSRDDGATWRTFRVSTKSWNPDEGFFSLGNFIGDYNGIAASNSVLYPVWTDGRNSAFGRTGIGETDIFTSIQIRR